MYLPILCTSALSSVHSQLTDACRLCPTPTPSLGPLDPPAVALPGQGDGRFLGVEELVLGVAGEEVEVVEPGGGGGLEYIAPDQVVLLVDEELPCVGLVRLRGLVQPILLAGLWGR